MEFLLDLMMLMSGEISMLTSLRNLAGMSSEPVALLGFRCWRRFCAPSVLMVILFISGVGPIPSLLALGLGRGGCSCPLIYDEIRYFSSHCA